MDSATDTNDVNEFDRRRLDTPRVAISGCFCCCSAAGTAGPCPGVCCLPVVALICRARTPPLRPAAGAASLGSGVEIETEESEAVVATGSEVDAATAAASPGAALCPAPLPLPPSPPTLSARCVSPAEGGPFGVGSIRDPRRFFRPIPPPPPPPSAPAAAPLAALPSGDVTAMVGSGGCASCGSAPSPPPPPPLMLSVADSASLPPAPEEPSPADSAVPANADPPGGCGLLERTAPTQHHSITASQCASAWWPEECYMPRTCREGTYLV